MWPCNKHTKRRSSSCGDRTAGCRRSFRVKTPNWICRKSASSCHCTMSMRTRGCPKRHKRERRCEVLARAGITCCPRFRNSRLSASQAGRAFSWIVVSATHDRKSSQWCWDTHDRVARSPCLLQTLALSGCTTETDTHPLPLAGAPGIDRQAIRRPASGDGRRRPD